MVNKFRIFLILAVLGLSFLFSQQFFSKFETPVGEVNLQPLDPGVEVEVENFKLASENGSSKSWELTADRAQVRNQENRTELKNVAFTLKQEAGREFVISADNGVMQNESRDIELEGNVRLVGQPSVLFDHAEAKPAEPAS
jgi:LPS export ABC transporter protein LptC